MNKTQAQIGLSLIVLVWVFFPAVLLSKFSICVSFQSVYSVFLSCRWGQC